MNITRVTSMSKVRWSDKELDKKIVECFEREGIDSPEVAVGPHTVLRMIKSDDVILGIVRLMRRLVSLRDSEYLKETSKRKYFLLSRGRRQGQ